MISDITRNFMEAIRKAESTGTLGHLIQLFSENAEVVHLNTETFQGLAGVHQYWQEYYRLFRKARTTFHNFIEADCHAVLEWTCEGELASGSQVFIRGVFVLDWHGDHFDSLRVYYDASPFISSEANPMLASEAERRE